MYFLVKHVFVYIISSDVYISWFKVDIILSILSTLKERLEHETDL